MLLAQKIVKPIKILYNNYLFFKMGKRKRHRKKVSGRERKEVSVPTSREQEASSSQLLARRRIERRGEPIPSRVRGIINSVLKQYPQLKPLDKDTVRILGDKSFESLVNTTTRADTHPQVIHLLSQTAKEFSPPIQIRLMPKGINFIADCFDRSPYIYVRQSEANKGLKMKSVPHHYRQEAKTIQQLQNLSAVLEENLHRSCRPTVHRVDTDRKRQAVTDIVSAEATGKFASLSIGKEIANRYRQAILEYLQDKETVILCSGLRLLVETEGKIIASAQYNANETATTYLLKPLIHAFAGSVKESYPLFNKIFIELTPEEVIATFTPIGTRISEIEISETMVKERLRALSGPSHQGQLDFYLSGEYFEKHLQLMPNEPFWP